MRMCRQANEEVYEQVYEQASALLQVCKQLTAHASTASRKESMARCMAWSRAVHGAAACSA